MDGFTAYRKKHKPEFFLFFDTFAAIRYSRRCQLVDMEGREVLAALKAGAMSEAVYSRKYGRLFLKSMLNDYLYIYDFNTGELKSLRKFGGCDREIFLTDDEENVVVFTNRGDKNLYLFQCNKKDDSGNVSYKPDLFTVLSEKPSPNHDIQYLLEGYYDGGCCYIAQYDPKRNALFVSVWKNAIILENVL